jgi:hypothetical protein
VFTYAYMTLDALDGKHARNTKQSGASHSNHGHGSMLKHAKQNGNTFGI